jgi:hypothetical protein
MTIRKIKASLVQNTNVDTYIGEYSYLFYDIDSGSLRIYDGTPGGKNLLGGGAGNPAGSDTQIQYNDSGVFGADANFTFSTALLTAGSFAFNIDQTIGAGQDNYVLTYDNGTGEISLEESSVAWGNITGTITDQTDLTTYIDNALEEEMFNQEVDFVTNDLIYRAEAQPGTATSAAAWRIRKIDIDNASKGDLSTTWADGNDNFDNVWDDRAILSYS